MAELPRYFTTEFTDVFLEAINKDAVFQKAARSMRETIALRGTDTPDKKDVEVRYRVHDGRIELLSFEEQDAPGPLRTTKFVKGSMLARTTAPYDFWVKLDKGEVGVIDVIMSPDYKLEGPKLKVLRYIRAFTRMGDVAAELPKRY